MFKVLLLLVPVVLIAGLIAFLVNGNKSVAGPLKGVSFSPKSTVATDLSGFFDDAKLVGNTVTWAGDWNDLSQSSGGPELVASQAGKYGLIPIILVTAYTEKSGSMQPIRVITGSVRQSYIDSAVAFVKKHSLKYFGVGIEINRIYEAQAANFDSFVSLFNDTATAIKTTSPTTKVFTVWQLEKMKGLNGGLYGGSNDATKNEWSLLAKLDQADFLAFTTYPGLIYRSPADIPSDYYSEIKTHTTKDVAFSEMGWFSGSPASGWSSSEERQAQFVSKFSELTAGLTPVFRVWSFLYDQPVAQPFTTMGLISSNSQKKTAYDAWTNLK